MCHTQKRASHFSVNCCPVQIYFQTIFRGFWSILEKLWHSQFLFFCLSSVCQITIQIPTLNARFKRDLSVTLSPPHTNTLGVCQKWQQTPNTKSLSFSPKSTKEDCPTILTAGGSAGMSPSALLNFPSWKKRERERESSFINANTYCKYCTVGYCFHQESWKSPGGLNVVHKVTDVVDLVCNIAT